MSSSPATSPSTLCPGTSRRSFMRLAGLTAATLPVLTESHFALAAQTAAQTTNQQMTGPPRSERPTPDSGAVMINANENPLGPCPAALEAITAVAKTGGRYDATGCQKELSVLLSKDYGLPASHIAVYAGSSEPLQFASMAFTSPSMPMVAADPSYEAGPPRRQGRRCQGPSPSPSPPPTPTTSRPWSPPRPTPASSTSATQTTPPAPSPPRRTSSGRSKTSPRAPSSWSMRPTSTSPATPPTSPSWTRSPSV